MITRTADPGRLKVLAVIDSLAGGGAERQMILLLRHLDRTRFDPMLCVMEPEGAFANELPPDVAMISLNKQARSDAPRLVRRLAQLVRREKPDVILAKLAYANAISAAAITVPGSRRPLVVTEESVPSAELTRLTLPRVRRAILRLAYGRAAAVIAVSPGVAEDLVSNFGINDLSVQVIPNMVDLEKLRWAARSQPSHRFSQSPLPLIVCIGRLDHAKGQRDLLNAAALLAQRRPINVLILGDGEDRDVLERTVRDLGIAAHVALPGFLADPFGLMAQADVIVSPSHWESFGNVLIEAMALGVPVVSTRVPAGPEWIIRDGDNGLFANPEDPADLAAAIELILDDKALAERLAAGGRNDAKRYDVGEITQRYAQALLAAAAGSSDRR